MALNTNLVAYYKLGDVNDSVGSNTLTNNNIVTFVAGKIGDGANFNGSNQYLSNTGNLSIDGGSFALSCWVKLNSEITSGIYGLVSNGISTSTKTGFELFYEYDGGTRFLRFIRSRQNVAAGAVNHAITLGTSNWHHLAMSYDGSSITAYVNGVSVGSASASGDGAGTAVQGFNIGRDSVAGGGPFYANAIIDETGIWSRALSADEVLQLFNSGRGNAYPLTDTPSLYGGVAYYKLDESSGNASDSINGKTLTASGTITYGTGKINNGASATWNSTNFLSNSAILPTNIGSGDITLSCWFKKNGASIVDSTPTIINFGTITTNGRIYLVATKTNGHASFYSYSSPNSTNVDSTTNICDNSWHLIVGTRSGTTMTIYVDGSQVAQNTGTIRAINESQLHIGTITNVSYDNLGTASIDEVAIFSRALSSTEVTALYNSGGGNQYPFTPVDTTARYWVGGTGTWDSSDNAHWSLSSNGASGASAPVSSTVGIYFDANSGGGTVTTSGTLSTLSIDCTGFTGNLAVASSLTCTAFTAGSAMTLSGSGAMTFSGNYTLASGMTLTHTGALTFTGTLNITTAGKTILSTITLNGTSFTLIDALTCTGASLTLTAGTFATAGFNISVPTFISSGANARVLTLTSNTITLTGTGTVWDTSTATNLTITQGTSTIKITDTSSTGKTFSGGGKTFNNLWLTGNGSGAYTIVGNNTFNDFKCDTPPHTINFTAGSTTTITTFTVNGTAGNLMTLQSTSSGSAWNIVRNTGGGVVGCDYLSIKDSNATAL